MSEPQWKPANVSLYECRGGICASCVCPTGDGVPIGDPEDGIDDLVACRECGRRYRMTIEVLEDPGFIRKPSPAMPSNELERLGTFLFANFSQSELDSNGTVNNAIRLLQRFKDTGKP